MRSISLLGLALVVGSGCSFVDDFDKFKNAAGGGADDGGEPADGVDASNPPVGGTDSGATTHDASVIDAEVGKDGGPVPQGDSGGPPVNDGGGMPPPASDGGSSGSGDAGDGSVARCGDGVIDVGEQCDDGNKIPGDGCEPDCTRTPPAVCNGASCDDGDVCTQDVCDPKVGCAHRTIDNDQDGFSPGMCKIGSQLNGDDCNDSNPKINPAAKEVCDGVDNNCNGQIDEGFTVLHCYPDRDGDGYPNLSGMPINTCATVCPAMYIAVADPTDTSINDCYDDPDGGADVHPMQMTGFERGYGPNKSFDYNCDTIITPVYPALPNGGCSGLLVLCSSNSGFDGMAPACGDSGMYSTCTLLNVGCSGTTDTRKQLCY